MDVRLRAVDESDLPIFFEHQLDAEATAMAAFRAREREAFMTHWRRILGDPTTTVRTVVCDGAVAGNVVVFARGGETLLGYWIGREFWGRGVATCAVRALLAELLERPLHARVATHNTGSIRVLEKCGFAPTGERETGDDGVEEIVFVLDG